MTLALRTFELDERARDFVREQLDWPTAFCETLLELVGSGSVFTRAPEGAPVERLYAFAEGGLLATDWSKRVVLEDGSSLVPIPNLQEDRAALIRAEMERVSGVLIADEVNPRWPDYAEHAGPTAFGVAKDVFHLATMADDVGAALLMGSYVWHGIAAVCPAPLVISLDRQASVDDLRASARSATLVTCTAYDGEGYVVWKRD